MKSKKTIAGISVVVVVAAVLIGIVCVWIFRDFDAQGYVNALLAQNLKGSVKELEAFVEDKNVEELEKQYEDGVRSFVEKNITAGVEMDEELEAQYVEVCKEIFKDLEFETKEAEKISRKEYHVPVEFKSVDVFQRFIKVLPEEKARIEAKVEEGQYKGTKEEITEEIQLEYMNNALELLKTSYEEMEFVETETMIFVVKKNADGFFEVDHDQMYELIVKIMRLDANQD